MKKLMLSSLALIIFSFSVSSGTSFGQQGSPPDAPQPQTQNHSTQQLSARDKELKRTPRTTSSG